MFDTLSRVDPASARPERHALDEALMDRHPVLRASPNPLRDRVSEAGRLHRCGSGERVVSEGAVGFVLRGSLAVFDRQELACVHLLGPGSTFGWEAALAPEQSGTPLLGLLDSEWIELPATVPTRAMGPCSGPPDRASDRVRLPCRSCRSAKGGQSDSSPQPGVRRGRANHSGRSGQGGRRSANQRERRREDTGARGRPDGLARAHAGQVSGDAEPSGLRLLGATAAPAVFQQARPNPP
jgi:hypothetical protein